jgi:hypothetical protein
MPGSVANAVVPTVSGHPLVFPQLTYRSFVETHTVAGRFIEYHDGTTERMNLVSTARRSWKLGVRLAPAAMVTLMAFLRLHKTDPFYWYNPKENASGHLEGSNYDPTGASVVGRYTASLTGDFAETIYIPRTELSFGLVEVV